MVDTEHQASVPADARPTEVPASATTGGEEPEVLAPPHPVQAPSGVSVPALETASEPIKTDTTLPTAPAEMMLGGMPPANVGIPPESVPGTTSSIAAPADEGTGEVEKAEEARAEVARAEVAKTDEVATEAKPDEPKPDEPKPEEPKPEEPKPEEPKPEEPKPEEPKPEEPKPEEPKPEEPKPEEPKPEEPKPEEPKPEEPKADAPTVEPTPSADAPTKETPSASQPTATATSTQPAAEDGLTHMEMAMPHVKYAQNTIRSLKSRREAAAFLQPVDPIALNIPHYTQIITHPMDLGTIDQKLALTAFHLKGPPGSQNRMSDKLKQAVDSGKLNMEQDQYKYVDEFERDVFLVFDNCKRFNGAEHIFTKNAEALRGVFEKQRKGLASAVAVANEANANEAKRRSSSTLPTIRRSSSNGGRPKREIHPPANRDLPWTEEHLHPASKRAILNRHGKNGQLTPREQAYWSKVINDELKFCVRVIDDLLKPAHQDLAWVFYDIPAKDFDWAPAYYATIKKPIALTPIQRKLKTGGYADLAAFDADMQLMFNNCFTFNPPDSDVYVMGARLKDVYEGKMQKKPVPPPLEPEEEMDVDDDDDEDEDLDPEDANAVLVQQLQRQIAELEGTLETLENSKSKNPVLITSTRVALNSVQAALAGAMSVSGMMGKKGKKRSNADVHGSAKKGKSKGEPKKKAKKASGSPAPRKRSAGSDEEDVRTVTFDQKEELAAKITELTDERLEGAIRILNEDKPPGQQGGEDDEIELDIDELSPQTLYKLYKYVVRPKKKNQPELGPNGKPAPASAPIDGRKRGTGGLKKKNLDETEEAERIARLQQQLQQFNDPDHTPKPATPAEAEASSKHDDLVQSDSSSGEEESDSDSDMD
ncbi:uncharacterized protein MJAP1_002010 [Malassezia japonica]|uniref:Bromodomain-containing protein n=1 Tax=Malassezia japonica TaxID=223818 RepID=A0AAF0EY04_9BASI|nr:uncharacterized protein MJAP1_002010 [Malassezia japonica]WFD39040.1 hypothetical protein MJAP1_002010 [Malassezia japonica]